jgi:hypothetical protein
MKHVAAIIMISLLILGLMPVTSAQSWTTAGGKEFDLNNLSPEDIETLKELRHEFYEAEKGNKEELFKQGLIKEATMANRNQGEYDMRYYGINLSLNFSSETIDGYVDYQILPLVDGFSTVDLDLTTDLTVTSVTVEGSPAVFSQIYPDLLTITTPTSYDTGEEFDMRVYYNGTPRYVSQQGMEFDDYVGAPMCWTNCEPWGTRNWLPCKDTPADKPDSVDLWLEYPSSYTCVSVGAIESDVSIGGGRNLIHYKHMYPIATYLIAITCSDFISDEQVWNYDTVSMPIYSWAMYWNNDGLNAFRTYMPNILTYLSDAFGLYPFHTEKAGNANYGWGGAMEHQTTSFYSPWFYDEWVIAHETAHQWWGDMITCASFHHIWLNEGGASYGEPLYFERKYGTSAYHSYMQTQKYLGGGTIFVEDPVTQDIFDQNLSYDKASWVWHMLRGVIGDDAFFQFMLDWHYSEFQYGSATTGDFAAVLSDSYGEDMTWFVDQWIYGEGHPEYELSWECLPSNEKADSYDLTYYVEQTQSGGTYFTMPIRTIFETTGDDLDTTLWNNGASVHMLTLADSVTNIVIDPEEWILREYTYVPFSFHLVTFELPDAELGVPYAETLQVVGGVPPFEWTWLSGDMPYGLSFDFETGVFSGTPTWAANYYFTLQVNDFDDPPSVDQRAYQLRVVEPQEPELVGDVNGDELINVSDVVFLIDYVFGDGPPPDPESLGDCDCNGSVNVSDVVFLINYVFGDGPEPSCP